MAASFAFAACGHSGSTPSPASSATAVATATGSAPASLSSPCASSLGIAYEPDAGNGAGFNGIQVVHFEDNGEHLCGAVTPTSTTSGIRLDGSAGPLAVSQDESDALALIFNGATNGYSLAQDLFGATIGQLVPAGTFYNLSVAPTPAPVVTLAPGASPSPSPNPTPTAALIGDATSVTILNGSSTGVALFVSPNTNPQGIVALTSLANAPPQYGSSVPFSSPNYTLPNPLGTSFSNIRAMSNATTGVQNVLVRGTNDLIAIGVTDNAAGYQFNIQAQDTNLGSSAVVRGYGRMAIDPQDPSRALIGGTSSGNLNQLTLVTGMPGTITESSTLQMPGAINSIAYSPGGSVAVIGTTVGIVVVGGTSSTTLTQLTPFGSGLVAYQPTFTNCNGARSTLTNVVSVSFSADELYVVGLGTAAGVSCASGYNGTLVAVPLSGSSGATPVPGSAATPTAAPSGSPSPSPFPTFFQQNNVIAPPAGADYLLVH